MVQRLQKVIITDKRHKEEGKKRKMKDLRFVKPFKHANTSHIYKHIDSLLLKHKPVSGSAEEQQAGLKSSEVKRREEWRNKME